MGDDHNQQDNILHTDEAQQKLEQGIEAWNKWAENHEGYAVDFSDHTFEERVSFDGFIFPGKAYFRNAQFSADASFIGTKFHNVATFWNANFKGSAFFNKTEFYEAADFKSITLNSGSRMEFIGAVFSENASFSESKLEGPLNLEGSKFEIVPDFRRSELKSHFTLHNIKVRYKKHKTKKFWGFFSKVNHPRDIDKFRRLKEIAVSAKDHDKELEFFANELKAKRGYEVTDLALLLSFLYEWCCDFGRSVIRPFILLVATWFVFGIIYKYAAMAFFFDPSKLLSDGWRLSAAILTPFSGPSSRVFAKDGALEQLFGTDPGFAFYILAYFEGFLGIAFLFLIGLALRNRFRI